MKSYIQIDTCLSWKDLIPKIEPEISALLIKDESNYVAAWGIEHEFEQAEDFDFDKFEQFRDQFSKEYCFGYFSYDLKNNIEHQLSSNNEDLLDFPISYFFVPFNVLIVLNGVGTYYGEMESKELRKWVKAEDGNQNGQSSTVILEGLTNKDQYLQNLLTIKEKIQHGDIYEMNYCISYKASTSNFNTFSTFKSLQNKTEAPFSAYFDTNHGAILSASPERFVKKVNQTLTSQPIKGSAPRSKDKMEDERVKNALKVDPKERSENIMIVDLVRNDLSKLAEKNSVVVEELCGTYSFKTIHQLISSIKCEQRKETTDSDLIKGLFPMGSMTGAPKISAMKIAEESENFKRGVYSGALGFYHPNGNCDFSVVIRSLLYSKKTKIISTSVGGAITIQSDPEKEYQECMTKLKALQEALC